MKYTKIPGVEKPVSRLALGTMIVNTRDRAKSYELLDAALELGLTTLDCANVYAGGDSERAIGDWLRDRGNRERVVIVTKGAHHNQDRQRVTPHDITADLHDSLARLKTDHVDHYMLHRDDPSLPVGPIVDVLNLHLKAGRIRSFGGSNWSHQRLQEANAYAKANGLTGFVASSPNFSLAEQVQDPWGPGCVTIGGPAAAAARTWYQANQMPILAYSSLARGFLSGRITRGNFEQEKGNLDDACRKAYCHEVNFKRLDRAHQLAQEKRVTVPQIALAWILNQPLNVVALIGAANRDEIAANVAALEIVLTADEVAWLDLRGERAAPARKT